MSLVDQVGRFLRDHDLVRSDTAVVCAVSGGPDSTALVHLLVDLAAAGSLRLAGLAHFNHQLRPAADEDERFCEQLARVLKLRLFAGREDIRARASRDRCSIEAAAHDARYAFLERARTGLGADVVALGHSRDDQAETFLLRLLRGAGARGLAAMYPSNGAIIRPLLDCRRKELRAYLESRGLPFQDDASNADVSIPRNRVRAELVPLLEERFNPSIVDVLADEADIAREEWRLLAASADDLWQRICRQDGDTWRLDARGLVAAPPALARLVVRRAMTEASRDRPITFAHVETVLRLSREGRSSWDGPRHLVERLGADVVLRSRPGGRPRPAGAVPTNFFRYPLSIPGEARIPEARCVVSAESAGSEAEGRAVLSSGPQGASALLSLAECLPPLGVRSRRPGDRFRPVGLGGSKKLQDYFVDRKVARAERDQVPIVVDRLDRIVWVGGHCADEAFRVTNPAQGVLVLKLTKIVGGPA